MSYILLGEDSRFAAEVWVFDYTGDFLFCVAKCCKYGRERKALNKIAGNTLISDIHSKRKRGDPLGTAFELQAAVGLY